METGLLKTSSVQPVPIGQRMLVRYDINRQGFVHVITEMWTQSGDRKQHSSWHKAETQYTVKNGWKIYNIPKELHVFLMCSKDPVS